MNICRVYIHVIGLATMQIKNIINLAHTSEIPLKTPFYIAFSHIKVKFNYMYRYIYIDILYIYLLFEFIDFKYFIKYEV